MLTSKQTGTAATVGELIDLLEDYDRDAPLECEFEHGVEVSCMHDYSTGEFAHADISGADPN